MDANIVEDNVETAIENGYALLTNENGDVYYVKLDEEAVTVQSRTSSNDEISVKVLQLAVIILFQLQ